MRENDEITGLFRSRLAGAEMTVREDFWEGLQRDLPSPVAAKGRRPLFLSPRFHRVAAAASVVFVLGAASAAFWYFSPKEEIKEAFTQVAAMTPEGNLNGDVVQESFPSIHQANPMAQKSGTQHPANGIPAGLTAQADEDESMSVHVSIRITQRVYGNQQQPGNGYYSNGTPAGNGFICDACHSYGTYAPVIAALRDSTEKDALLLLEKIMDLPSVHMHGPEHHAIVPCVLLTAFRNNGEHMDYDAALSEICKRAKQVPGGTCGYWGVCGAAAGAGIFMSVMTGSSPLHKDAWPFPQKLVSIILSRLADVGGPRCCKRTSRIAIEEAVHFYSQFCSVNIPLSSITCKYCEDNRECIQEDCPYYPE